MSLGIDIGTGIGLGFLHVASAGGDVVAPTLSSAVINAAGTVLTLTYNEALDASSTPASGAFALGGTGTTVASVLVSGSTVALTLSGVIGIGVAVTVSYTAGGAPIQDVAGNDAANLVAQAVTNNSTQDVTAPTLSSAVINTAGTSLTLTYSEALDTGSVPALGAFALAGTILAALTGTPNVTGSTVVLTLAPGVTVGETGITISYTAGGAPIQDVAGNDAANLVTQAVTNNSTRAYSPADEGNLVWWGDMNDPTTYTESGGIITARANKVTAVAVTPTGSPGYQATGLNSLPTADYDGVNMSFLGTEAAVVAVAIDSAAKSVFAVAAFDVVDRLDALVGWGNSGFAANRSAWFGQTSATTGRLLASYINDAGTAVAITGVTQSNTTAHVYSWVHTGAAVTGWIDNVEDLPSTAFAPGTLTADRFAIGERPTSARDRRADAQISEELVYSVALSSAARTRVNAYLKAKWGTP